MAEKTPLGSCPELRYSNYPCSLFRRNSTECSLQTVFFFKSKSPLPPPKKLCTINPISKLFAPAALGPGGTPKAVLYNGCLGQPLYRTELPQGPPPSAKGRWGNAQKQQICTVLKLTQGRALKDPSVDFLETKNPDSIRLFLHFLGISPQKCGCVHASTGSSKCFWTALNNREGGANGILESLFYTELSQRSC